MTLKPYKVINSDIWSIATNSFVNRKNDSAASALMTCFPRYAIPQKAHIFQFSNRWILFVLKQYSS